MLRSPDGPSPQDDSTGRFLTRADLSEYQRIRRNLTIALAAVLVVVVVGVVGYIIIGGRGTSVMDALYMTAITLSTVGFEEVIDLSESPLGRIFTVGLLVSGMGLAAYTLSMVAALLVEGQLHHIYARRRMEKAIDRMQGHYIVCGNTTACAHVVEELVHTDRPCMAVVSTDEDLEKLRNRCADVPVFVGDPSDDEVLKRARVDRATGVVFCMESDKDNLLGVFTARRLAPGTRIVAAAESSGARAKLVAAGASAVVSPGQIGGLRMASELLRPVVVSFLDQMLRVGDGSLRVEEVEVPPGAGNGARTIASLAVREVPGALLLAVRHAGEKSFTFDPDPEIPLADGMVLVVMADAEGRKRLEGRMADLAGGAG